MAKSKKPKASAGSKAKGVFPLHEIESILALMTANDVAEFEWEQGGTHVKLRTKWAAASMPMVAHAPMAMAAPMASAVPVAAASPASAKASGQPELNAASNHKKILSPFVGTFYRKPAPDKPNYVNEGQSVKVGDTLCIIEAMKLMNEIESEVDGRVVKILVENLKSVEYGQALFLIDPKAAL